MSGTEVQPHEGDLLLDDRADLDQLQSDRLAGGLRELSTDKCESADRFHERVSQAG